MKQLFTIALIIFCKLLVQPAGAQTLPADSSYSTSFDFLNAKGEPTGTFLYKGEGEDPLVVFAYTDGRKFLGHVHANHPSPLLSVVYYPDGTIYTGTTPVGSASKQQWEQDQELTVGPCNIRYTDGTVFVGNADHIRYRDGFMFAPDGSYTMGGYWWRNIFASRNFKTVYYSKDHKRLADKYQFAYKGPEMDFETFLKLKKKEPLPKKYQGENLSWEHETYTNKKDHWARESIAARTTKWHLTTGYYWDRTTHSNSDTVSIAEGYAGETDQWYSIDYTEPGYDAHIANFGRGAIRSQIPNGMLFKAYNTKDALAGFAAHIAYNNGDSYSGSYIDNVPYGYGIYTFANGNVYYGNYQRGERGGWGTFRFADGRYYKGMWKDDRENGPGRLYSKTDEILQQGLYADNKLQAPQKVDLGYYELINEFPATKTEAIIATTKVTDKRLDGGMYTGSIANGKPEGEGTLKMDVTGDTYAGKWHNGLPDGIFTVNYSPLSIGGKTLNAVYVGGLKDFKREGLGIYTAGDYKLSGTFHNGVLNGPGTSTYNAERGITESGNFVNGLREGKFLVVPIKVNEQNTYYTYVHDVLEGHAYITHVESNMDAEGDFHNGKRNGTWTAYMRNEKYYEGAYISVPTRAGYITYNNGVIVSSQVDVEVQGPSADDVPICSYCHGEGGFGSGKFFMGREIPMLCPRCGGTGHTWLNPKN